MLGQHAFQQAAQIGRRLQVAVVEQVVISQPWPICKHPAARHRSAEQERRAARAMIGAETAIDPRGATELGDNHDNAARPRLAQPLAQRRHAVIQRVQRTCEARHLCQMRVPCFGAFQGGQPGAFSGCQQFAGDTRQPGEAVAFQRIGGCGFQHLAGEAALLQAFDQRRAGQFVIRVQRQHLGEEPRRRRLGTIGKGANHLAPAQQQRHHRPHGQRHLAPGGGNQRGHPIEPAAVDLMIAAHLQQILAFEMAAIAGGAGDGVQRQHRAVAIHRSHRRECGMQAEDTAQIEHAALAPGLRRHQRRAQPHQIRIAIGDDGAQPVHRATQQHHHQPVRRLGIGQG